MFNVKRLIHKAIPEVTVPPGTLQASDLQPRLAVHSGVPAQAQVLAYEPVQRLLAVGSSDGRVKVFGGDGIEGLLRSPTKSPTLFLQFVENKGKLIHVTTLNQIEVWDLEERKLLASCTWDTEVAAIAQVPGSNYIYVGDDTGVVRVLELRKELLHPLPYCIPPHVTLAGLVSPESETPLSVVAILPQPDAVYGRLLIAYSNGLLALWALHEGKVLALRGCSDQQKARLLTFEGRPSQDGNEDGDEEGTEQLRCATWLDAGGALLATGYDNGDIKFWSLPGGKVTTASESEGFGIETEPLRLVRLARGSFRAPVTALRWSGASSRDGGRMYVLGGGSGGTPDVVRVVSLTPPDSASSELLHRELPWFGPVSDALLTPPPGGLFGSPASAAIVLSSPGQLHLYDEPSISDALTPGASEDAHPPLPQPLPLLEQQTPITVSETVTGTAAATGLCTLLQLPRDAAGDRLPSGGKWPVEGGAFGSPPPQEEELFTVIVTGHECGKVVLWDACTPVLRKVCTVIGKGKESEKCPPVSGVAFCPVSGLLVVAHEGGRVRLYILGTEDRELTQHNIDADGKIGKDKVHATRGLQLVSTLQMHEASVRSIAIASSHAKLAMGDDDGMVSIFDLTCGTFINLDRAFDFKSPIAALAFSTFPAPQEPGSGSFKAPPSSPPKRTLSNGSGNGIEDNCDDKTVLLYVAAATAAVTVLDGSTGLPAGTGPVQTKNASKAVDLVLLDSQGRPLPPLHGPLSLPWAFEGALPPMISTPPKQKLTSQKSGGSAMDRLKAFYAEEGPSSPKESGKSSPRNRDGSPKRGPKREFGEFEALFVLLVSEDCLRLYTAAAIHAGDRTTLKKEKLEGGDCVWAAAVGAEKDKLGAALVSLSRKGEIHVRSLPDLSVLQEGPLSGAVGWPLDVSVRRLRAASAASDGRVFLPDAVGETLRLSLYKKENVLGLPGSLPHLHDHVLAAAADAAAVASKGAVAPPASQEAKTTTAAEDKKKKNFFTSIKAAGDNIRVVAEKGLSEVKNLAEGVVAATGAGSATSFLQPGRSSGTVLAPHGADELPNLFSSRPFAPAPRRLPRTAELRPSTSSNNLDIDDIDLESPATSSNSLRSKVTARVSSGFATIRRKSTDSRQEAEPPVRERDDRARLFDGAAESGPKQRSAAEIRAAYGKPGAAQASAAQARDKLLERQEKLQGLDRKTAEMQEGAANFASMASELEKKMAGRKWWQI